MVELSPECRASSGARIRVAAGLGGCRIWKPYRTAGKGNWTARIEGIIEAKESFRMRVVTFCTVLLLWSCEVEQLTVAIAAASTLRYLSTLIAR